MNKQTKKLILIILILKVTVCDDVSIVTKDLTKRVQRHFFLFAVKRDKDDLSPIDGLSVDGFTSVLK